MFSIGRLLGHDEKFFDLLEASAQQADSSVHHLVDLLQKLDEQNSVQDLAAFAESRREDKRITQRLAEAGRIIHIEVLDHIIIGEQGQFVSLKERGLI